jgi:hypothetical protein
VSPLTGTINSTAADPLSCNIVSDSLCSLVGRGQTVETDTVTVRSSPGTGPTALALHKVFNPAIFSKSTVLRPFPGMGLSMMMICVCITRPSGLKTVIIKGEGFLMWAYICAADLWTMDTFAELQVGKSPLISRQICKYQPLKYIVGDEKVEYVGSPTHELSTC